MMSCIWGNGWYCELRFPWSTGPLLTVISHHISECLSLHSRSFSHFWVCSQGPLACRNVAKVMTSFRYHHSLEKSLPSASFKPFTPEFSTKAAETFQHALDAFLYPTDTLTVLTVCHQACKHSLCPQGIDTTEGQIQAGNSSTFWF